MTQRARQAAVALSLLLAALAIYVLRLNGTAGLMVDDAWYMLLGKSLAESSGYRLISSATDAILPLYPPGHPAVLSLMFRINPDFPENVWLLKSASIAAMMAVGALTFVYLRGRQLSRELAALAAVATVLVPAFVFLATSTLMSECLFTLAQLATIVALQRGAGLRDRRDSAPMIAIAALMATASVLVRSAAAGLVLASTLWLLKERKWRAAAVFAGTIALSLGPWLLYTSVNAPTTEQRQAHGGAVVYSYSDQISMRWAGTPAMGRVTLADIPARLVTNVTDIAARGIGGIFLPVVLRGPQESGEEVIGLGGVAGLLPGSMGIATGTMISSLIFTAIVAVGFVAVARRQASAAEFVVPVSLAIVLLWPFWSFRFLLPLTPYLFHYLIVGLDVVSRSTRVARPALLCILGLYVYDHAGHIVQARVRGEASLSEWSRSKGEVDAALEWVEANLAADGMVASTNPALLYLHTGRKSIAFDDPTRPLHTWRDRGVRYVVCLLPSDQPAGGPAEFSVLYQSPAKLWVIDLRPRR